ncbi:hypothetical protein ILUMI_25953 [Ignelater luminosus]|uniref:Uncharacterized protein n=1 Tax=Ignelater luminosus TaxID=2038154 RepID=A0A8K0C7E5_IGNLU|nr:hypothetical protein ILUMI_25953 [Ignelater luminosus]
MSENIGVSVHSRTTNIVEQILEQGQRLRNAMVKSILDNDPFYIDVVDKNSLNNSSIQKSKLPEQYINYQRGVSSNQKQNILNFEWDGLSPIDSPPTMSGEFSDLYCNCEICNAYGSHTVWASKNLPFKNLKKDSIPSLNLTHVPRKLPEDIYRGNALREMDLPEFNRIVGNSTTKSSSATTGVQTQSDNFPEEITKSIQDNYRSKAAEYFKYVNSLKIAIHSLTLNQAGNRKVQVSSVDSKYKLPASINHSYFIEYSIPECLINTAVQSKIQSKVDSGLTKNLYRICSKRLQDEG